MFSKGIRYDCSEALQLSLSKESGEIETYQKLAAEYKVAHDVFLFLIEEERKHKQLLERKIYELTR